MPDIYGTSGNDTLFGTNRADDIVGRGGDDHLIGGAGNDDLVGSAGNDILDGGTGNDDMLGGAGADVFVYRSGADAIEDLRREDSIMLDADLGVASFAQLLTLARTVDGGDSTLFTFGGGNTLLLEDVRIGQLDASQFRFEADPAPTGSALPRNMTGTGRDEVLFGTMRADDITAHAGNDEVNGRGGADDIYGGRGNDLLRGGSGNDDIDGNRGNDRLFGNSGADDLSGGRGNDRLDGGRGNDEMSGGAGADTFVFQAGHDKIEDFRANDRILLDESLGVASFSELMDTARVVGGGDDVLFDFGDGNSLRLEDTTLRSLDAGDFVFL